uniref:Uncharacterized protein n=1 Tax=Manihot esculenta TaxID=3983 RepID=A0A2C9W3N0_MANES
MGLFHYTIGPTLQLNGPLSEKDLAHGPLLLPYPLPILGT